MQGCPNMKIKIKKFFRVRKPYSKITRLRPLFTWSVGPCFSPDIGKSHLHQNYIRRKRDTFHSVISKHCVRTGITLYAKSSAEVRFVILRHLQKLLQTRAERKISFSCMYMAKSGLTLGSLHWHKRRWNWLLMIFILDLLHTFQYSTTDMEWTILMAVFRQSTNGMEHCARALSEVNFTGYWPVIVKANVTLPRLPDKLEKCFSYIVYHIWIFFLYCLPHMNL
jgi:hypothetical protein